MRASRFLLLPALTAAIVTTGGALAPAANAQPFPGPGYLCHTLVPHGAEVHGTACLAINGAPSQGPITSPVAIAHISAPNQNRYQCQRGLAHTRQFVRGTNCHQLPPQIAAP